MATHLILLKFLFLLFFSSFWTSHAHYIKPGNMLSSFTWPLLDSPSGRFSLNFMSWFNYTYFGVVQFLSNDTFTIIWHSSQGIPTANHSEEFILENKDGALRIRRQGGIPITLCSFATNKTVPTLLDSGNFVFNKVYSNGSTKRVFWQSFDHLDFVLIPGMKHLEIWTCSKLTSLSSRNELPMALKYLQVYNCPKLESLANKLPNNASLEYLKISHCQEIKFLPEGLHKLNHLIEIHVDNCCSVVSFPDGGFLPTHLRKILITNCVKLEALPRMHNLTSLQTLCIYECTSTVCFPEDAFPTNLKELLLKGVANCKQGLNRLTSLRRLTIYGNGFQDWQSFPEEDDGKMMMLLPTSLTSLWILNFSNIVLLSSKAFQNLSALEKLYIDNFPKLAYLPEGLPRTLLKLYVYNCPALKQQCKKGKGQEWLKKINSIPLVKIDYQSIYELEEDEE